MICEILKLDAEAAKAGVTLERYTKGADGQYAFPDVFAASWQGGLAAYEIQLATTQLPTIIRREDFYEENAIRLCWIVSGDIVQLKRRAFKTFTFAATDRCWASTGKFWPLRSWPMNLGSDYCAYCLARSAKGFVRGGESGSSRHLKLTGASQVIGRSQRAVAMTPI